MAKTYMLEYRDNIDLISPGIYSIYHKPHFNLATERNEVSGVIVKITKQTNQNALSAWMAKMYSTEWILPPESCAIVKILSLNRIDK